MKRQYLATLGGLLTFAIIACNQNTPNLETAKVLGTLELSVSNGLVGQAKFTPAKLGTQAILNESQLVFTPSAVATFFTETNGTRNFDYVSRNFTITNNTGASVNNLTLVALAKTGNLGGTAIKSATAFNGSTTDAATAQLARPTHTMIASGGGAVVDDQIDISRASFQALTTSEATAIQNDSNFATQGLTGTVLEYGFAATNSTATNRTITNGSSGKVSIAMRFPKPSTATNTYNFVMTFAVTAESTNRVTRSPEDTTAKANARATILGATQKVLIDDPAVIAGANIPSGYTVQSNVKTGTGGGQNLLKNPAKLVLARLSPGGSTGGAVYTSDFVEIFNSGEFSTTLGGKSLQYGSLNGNLGTTTSALNVNTIDVSSLGIIAPGTYKLVSTPNQANAALTATPATETSSAWVAAFNFLTGGKIALVDQTASLDCGGNPAITPGVACNPTQTGKLIDLLCYQRGNTSCTTSIAEGSAFDYTSQTTLTGDYVISRVNKGCTDANNSTDFAGETITNTGARNSSTPAFVCP